jgi:hypothetical protein
MNFAVSGSNSHEQCFDNLQGGGGGIIIVDVWVLLNLSQNWALNISNLQLNPLVEFIGAFTNRLYYEVHHGSPFCLLVGSVAMLIFRDSAMRYTALTAKISVLLIGYVLNLVIRRSKEAICRLVRENIIM